MLSIEKTVRLVISLVAVAVIACLLSLTTTQVGAQIYNMDRDYNDPYVEKPGPEDDSGPQKPRPPLPEASPYSSPAPTKDPSGCVIAGCSGTLCVEASDPRFATTCEYLPKYQCYNDLTCTRLESGDCGFQEQDQLQQCLAEYEDGDDEDDQTTPDPEYSFFQRLPGELRDTATELDFGGSAIELELDDSATYVDVSEFELNDPATEVAPVQIVSFTTPEELDRRVELLAQELDIDNQGSYVFSAYYDSDGRILNPPNKRTFNTRIQFEAEENTQYYALIGAFGNREGTVSVTVDYDNTYLLQPLIRRPNIDDIFRDLDEIPVLGRVATDFAFDAPRFRNISSSQGLFDWQRSVGPAESSSVYSSKQVWIKQRCSTESGPFDLEQGERVEAYLSGNLDDEGVISTLTVTPQSTNNSESYQPFLPGRDYIVVGRTVLRNQDNIVQPSGGPYPAEELGRFSTTNKNIYDLTGDGIIDISDYSILISEYLDETRVLAADYNCDDVVDIEDYSQLIRRYSGGDYAVTE